MEHTSLKKPHLSNNVTDKVGRIQENAIVETSLEKPTRDVAISGSISAGTTGLLTKVKATHAFGFIWRVKLNVDRAQSCCRLLRYG